MSTQILRLVITLALCGSAALAQVQATCQFTTFQIPNFVGTNASGINRYGNVVGSAFIVQGDRPPLFIYTAFIRFADGSVKLFKAPGLTALDTTTFNKRNALGMTIGGADGLGGFVFYKGTWQKILGPGGRRGGPSGINVYGSFVGGYLAGTNGPVRGFKLKNGQYTIINFPGSLDTEPSGISDSGVIIGTYGAADGNHHSFVLTNGVYTRFDHPLANPADQSGTQLLDINASGAMVGVYPGATGFKSFIFKNGVFKDVVVPGAESTTIAGINGFGAITGTATFQGVDKGFIGTNCR